MNEHKSDPPAKPDPADEQRDGPQPQPVDRPVVPTAKDAEMGGEAPCQLHQWWDHEDDGSGRAARFAALDRLRSALPQYPEEEVLADVDEAVRAARQKRADGRT